MIFSEFIRYGPGNSILMGYLDQMWADAEDVKSDKLSIEAYAARYGENFGGGLGGLNAALNSLMPNQVFNVWAGKQKANGGYRGEWQTYSSTIRDLVEERGYKLRMRYQAYVRKNSFWDRIRYSQGYEGQITLGWANFSGLAEHVAGFTYRTNTEHLVDISGTTTDTPTKHVATSNVSRIATKIAASTAWGTSFTETYDRDNVTGRLFNHKNEFTIGYEMFAASFTGSNGRFDKVHIGLNGGLDIAFFVGFAFGFKSGFEIDLN